LEAPAALLPVVIPSPGRDYSARPMILLDPNHLTRSYPDERSRDIMRATVGFFEDKGKAALKRDDHARAWYQDFIDFQAGERIFATLLTPAGEGAEDCRWDTWRLCEFAEILGFYGLPYWYTWQVSILGLGPIWMSANEGARRRAARQLEEGEIFAFGLSEKTHGADVYATDMILSSNGNGGLVANGEKYYIGNGNAARMVSTFGRLADGDEYAFFAADSQHPSYELIRNVVESQNYVSNFRLRDYPVGEEDVLHRGGDAFHAALNTVNIGKYNLGWASIGICTHAMYEAVTHAANRRLYGLAVTDFPHVKRLFTDAYARLVAMKLVALRACDYMRSASLDDRRYLLYNPIVKMKVTTEGERAVGDMADVIAAKGFEKDMYFEAAGRDIQALPKLEGTVHVNIALIVKFMANYMFNPAEMPAIGRRDDAANDAFLFDQGPTRGLGNVRFHDYRKAFERHGGIPHVAIFAQQVEVFRELLETATPTDEQQRDIDFLLAVGQLFALIVYAGLVLENAPVYDIPDDLVDEIFGVFVRDFSAYAVQLHGRAATTHSQADLCLGMVRRPAAEPERYERVWAEHVMPLAGAYEMRP
jgi:acyl-CoA dehydrogenase